jgi:hypothetical protein
LPNGVKPERAVHPSHVQLDLFLDTRDVMLRNDVIAALRERDAVAGNEALAVLRKECPGDPAIASLATLLNGCAPVRPLRNHDAAADAVCALQETIVPAAQDAFGASEAGGWLAFAWQSMARAAAGLPYDPARPHAHPAFMFLQAGDWPAARRETAAIPAWRRIPIPLGWMAEARFGESGLDGAWPLLVELAWIDPVRFGALARRLEAPPLRRLLNDFELGFESGGEEDLAWLPAWALVVEPGLARILRETQICNDTASERAARLVMDLLILERQGRHGDLVDRRKRLRDLNPALFAHYMSTR